MHYLMVHKENIVYNLVIHVYKTHLNKFHLPNKVFLITERIDSKAVEKYVEKLLSLYKYSPWGNIAQGLILLERNEMIEAKTHIRTGNILFKKF